MAWTGQGLCVLRSRAPLARVNLLPRVHDHLGVKVRRSASPSFTIEEPAPQAGAFDSPLWWGSESRPSREHQELELLVFPVGKGIGAL